MFKRNIFSSTNLLTQATVAVKLDEIIICSLFNVLFIYCFKLIYTLRVINCKRQPQGRHKQV